MGGKPAQPETPAAAPAVAPAEAKEAAKSKVDQWSLKAMKVKAGKAWDVIRKKGDWSEKLTGLWGAIFDEIETVETEEEKKKRETATQAGAILKNMDTKNAVQALAPSFAVTDKEGNVQEAPPVVTTVLTAAYDSAKGLDNDREKAEKAKSGETMGFLGAMTDKLDPKKNPEKTPLTAEEKQLAFSYGARFAIELKKIYPNKVDFKNALDEFDKATKNAPMGFHSLKTAQFTDLFKFEKIPVVGISNPIDIYNTFEKIFDKIDIDVEDIPDLYKLGDDLKAGTISDTLKKYAEVILSNTKDPEKRLHVLQTIGQIMAQKALGATFPTNEQLTDIVFDIEDADLLGLSNLFA